MMKVQRRVAHIVAATLTLSALVIDSTRLEDATPLIYVTGIALGERVPFASMKLIDPSASTRNWAFEFRWLEMTIARGSSNAINATSTLVTVAICTEAPSTDVYNLSVGALPPVWKFRFTFPASGHNLIVTSGYDRRMARLYLYTVPLRAGIEPALPT
jgi:hypothetical protein